MKIRDQLSILKAHDVRFVVVGGQAGVLRQAIEFSHDLDILIAADEENAARVVTAVREVTGLETQIAHVLGRDFQQYVDEETGTELDVHLKLIAIPDYSSGVNNASAVDFLGLETQVLELPALYAAKRTDRPRDALHRRAIEDRVRYLVLQGEVAVDEIVLSLCLDDVISRVPRVALRLRELAAATSQALLQVRLIANGLELEHVVSNPSLHPTARSLLSLDVAARAKLLAHPARLSALLARVPLVLPAEGYRLSRT